MQVLAQCRQADGIGVLVSAGEPRMRQILVGPSRQRFRGSCKALDSLFDIDGSENSCRAPLISPVPFYRNTSNPQRFLACDGR